MPKAIISAELIPTLDDGLVGAMIDRQLLKISDDLDDRGHDGQKRKLVIELTFHKVRDEVNIDVKCNAKFPANTSHTLRGKVDSNAGGIVYRPDSPNPDQQTINDILDDKE